MHQYVKLWIELLRLSWRRQRLLTALVIGFQLLDIVTFAAIALAMRNVINHTAHGALTPALFGAVGLALAYGITGLLGGAGFSLRLQVLERVAVLELGPEVLRMIARIDGIEHLERTDFLDRVTVVRSGAWGIMDGAWGAVDTVLGVLRLAVTLTLLGTVDRRLLLLLAFAVVPLWFDHRAARPVKAAETATAETMRLQQHLFTVCTNAASGKEIRVAGAADTLVARQTDAWRSVVNRRFRARVASSAWKVGGWTVFSLGFAGALAIVMKQAATGRGTAGDIAMTISIATSLRFAVQNTVSRAAALAASRRLVDPFLWLREYAARELSSRRGSVPAPPRLRSGIALKEVSYAYPGTDRLAVDSVSITIDAGAVVAIVGEYGSGKTTLVKLLCKFYQPSAGAIRVDDTDLRELDSGSWRSRVSIAFQDFGRYHTTFAEAVGLGNLPYLDDSDRIAAAIRAADAERIVAQLPEGLHTQLGKEFDGIDLSEGQWQKTALARACMREDPLLFVLDEPTASLDAPSETVIFERYMRQARTLATTTGAVTLIVSHRFSTVAGADLILVMDKGRLVEVGSHDELMTAGGAYADLYSIQATAYRTASIATS